MASKHPSALELAQVALLQSEARKAALLQAVIGAILTVDTEGRITEVNEAAERMFGFSEGGLVGRLLVETIVPPELRDAHEAGMRRVVQGAASRLIGRRVRLVAQRADGSRFPVELAIARVGTGAETHFTGFLVDLTEQERQAEDLSERQKLTSLERDVGMTMSSSSQLDAALQSCSEHVVQHLDVSFTRIWTLDEDSRVLVLRASAGLYTHLDGEHSRIPLGQYKIGRIAKSQRPHMTNQVLGDSQVHDQAWAKREAMVAFAGYPLVVEGRTVGVLAMFAKRVLSENTLDSLAGIAHPIAIGIDRKRVEDELHRTAESLIRFDRLKNEFLAMLGHELRSPVQVIDNCLNLKARSASHDRELATIAKQVAHIGRLTGDLLEMSNIASGTFSLILNDRVLGAVVQDTAQALETLLAASNHQLVLEDLTQGNSLVRIDEMRFGQVLTNLVNNASKYSPPGSPIRLVLEDENDEVLVRVQDQGMGIDPEFLPELFDMFTQAPSNPEGVGGLGLGLALSKRIVEQHSGSIEVFSAGPGQGSTFTVRLPRAAPNPAVAEAQSPVAAAQRDSTTPPSGARRVLVVDDNLDAAESLARLVAILGAHEVTVAGDGPRALELAEQFAPDLVLLDLGLPGMDGLEVAQRMRSSARGSALHLVALTGYGGPEHVARSLEAGFDDHRVKPIGRSDLAELLRGR